MLVTNLDERRCVHRGQATGSQVPDDNRLHAVDAVCTDHRGAGDHREQAAVCARRIEERCPKTSRSSHLGRTQNDEHALPAQERAERHSTRSPSAAGRDHQVDSRGHCDRFARSGTAGSIGLLSVRRNASSCRSSPRARRSGRNSLCPIGDRGARL